MAQPLRPHLLLVNLGTPEAPTAESVREFLAEFLSDPAVVDLPRWLWKPILHRAVLRSRPARVAHQYQSIWTNEGSPLRVATERIVAEMRAMADGRFTVSSAYRYGAPSIETALQGLENGDGPVFVVPLFPQRTDATTGTVWKLARHVGNSLTRQVVARDVSAADPGYIAALASRWSEAVAAAERPPDHLVVSFHGIPVRYDRRERRIYTRDCEATTRAFLAAIDWPRTRATLAYQSKFGPEPWLQPATADVLVTLPRRGLRHVAVITPGFVTEGLETIEEIGMRGRASFLGAGGETFVRVGAVESHPLFLSALAGLAMV